MITVHSKRLATVLAGVLLFASYNASAAGGVDYATTIQPIFNATSLNCVNCHSPNGSASFLNLTTGTSYGQIVNKAGGKIYKNFLVHSNDPTNSAINFVIVTQGSGANHNGNSWVATAQNKTDTTNWINQGALPNLNAPTVASVSPSSGATGVTTNITITGTAFGGIGAFVPSVTVGGVACTNVLVVSFTSITCTVPASANAGAANVVVSTTAGGASNTLVGGFTFIGATPTVSSVSASSGPAVGGTNVTITGTNLTGASAVTFGGTAATTVTSVSATQVTCTTPAHAAGAVDVVVTATAGTGTGIGAFTYLNAPTVTLASPIQGPATGGTVVTLTGTGFVAGATVTFGGTAATGISVVSSTQINCTAPAHAAGAVNIAVTTTGGTGTLNNGYTYIAAPTIASITPNNGPTTGATSITIAGTDFFTGATVTIGGSTATSIVVVSASQITCTTPAHAAGAVNVVVSSVGGSVTSTNGFTYILAPTVTSVSPSSSGVGGGGTATLTGTGFVSGATVTFGAVSATLVNVVSATQITCTVPAQAAGVVTVSVTTTAGTGSLTNGFTYVDVPTITSVSPNTGSTSGATSVTISGTNFVSGMTVSFGGNAATAVSVTSATQLSCTTPAHAVGAVDVGITTVAGTVMAIGGFTYFAPPTLTSVTPNSGLAAGGNTVVLAGTNFFVGATVTFGGSAATSVMVDSATQITCTTPTHAAGLVNVIVTTSGGPVTLVGGYTYFTSPTITAVAPTGGSILGAQIVTLTGTNFIAGTTVTFGGIAATNVTIQSLTQLGCVIPAHAAGAVDVVVNNAGGTATSTSGFTYYDIPTITSVSPNGGSPSGGQTVVVTGTNFAPGSTVNFGGSPASNVTVDSLNQITCKSPAHAVGKVSLSVTTVTDVATLASAYTYATAPTITSVSTTTFVVGTPGTFTVTTTGSPTATLSQTGLALSGITFVDNGNGTATISGTPGAGSGGSYPITITATNIGGSTQQSFTLVIIYPNAIVGSGPDSDGDGFSDAFELAVGTLPLDVLSTPIGGAKAPSPPPLLPLASASIALNFAKSASDGIKFAGTVNIPAGFVPLGQKVYVDVGGVVQTYTLDAKGSAKTVNDTLKITIKATKGVVAAQISKFAVTYAKGTFAAKLADDGLTNTNVTAAPVNVVFTMILNNGVLQATKAMLYTGKVGKTGAAK